MTPSQKVLKILSAWQQPAHITLHAGEMSAQEMRSVLAVVRGIEREIRELGRHELEMNEKSNCCKASLSVETVEEGTSCYVCDECGNACDPA